MIPIRDRRPSYRFSWVTVSLIALNVIVFILTLSLNTQPNRTLNLTEWKSHGVLPYNQDIRATVVNVPAKTYFYFKFGAVPGEVASLTDLPPTVPFPILFTLITSTFLHGSFFHLLGNMLFLWIFGDNVEDAMGPIRFLLFYFLAGIAGAMLQIVANSGSGTPMVGASGAIAGVMAAYLLLYPNSRIVTLVPIFFFITFIEIPAFIMVGLWFLFELLRAVGQPAGQVARLAHVGGFIAGVLMTPYFKKEFIKIRLWDYLFK
ncbi:rhomboid family intramembrane serine protease [Candidatus Bipolaricaulota bacterium]|nr:rhomboid family intramembrane serine protease [Candidatus Bipolaricaulota bacterium]